MINAGDPLQIARQYDEKGTDKTFLGITAIVEQGVVILETIEAVAKVVFAPLTVGGGAVHLRDIQQLLAVGADKVGMNTSIVKKSY